MSNVQCFKIKRRTDFDKKVKEHFNLLPKWDYVFKGVSELLDENITRLAFDIEQLWLDITELKKEENKKLFTKDGKLKNIGKKVAQIRDSYKKIIKDVGLSGYQELKYINFAYGVMRYSGEEMESFRTLDYDIYYKTDFDLEKRTKGFVEPITELEYEEKYVEELKKYNK